MAKLLAVITLFIGAVSAPLCGHAQPDSICYIKGTANQYRVEYYRSTKFIQNVNNQLKTPNYRPDTLGLSGVRLRAFRDSLTQYIQRLFPAQTWHGLKRGHGIGLSVSVLGSGQVAELGSLSLPTNVMLSGSQMEELEGMLKTKRVVVTDPGRYKRVNFMPLFFLAYPLGR